ncbi:MAG: ATP-binding cassette domain-containing protein [Leptospirales bacterium]|nr:ATP-binding cassette domain-containing protein [Leptospirales bacterium]
MSLDVNIVKQLRHFNLHVSFSCRNRELLGIVGPSGAGKTTIIRTICGLEKPDSGRITHNDIIWTSTKDCIDIPTRKRNIGYVFQEYILFPNLNVYKNVAFAAKDHGKIRELMKRLDIWHLKDSMPWSISGGERQRCAICQTLAKEPEVLLMDEPFSAQDTLTRKKLRGMMKSLKNELLIPVLYVTHDIREARELSDDILPVKNGKVDHKWMLQFLLLPDSKGFCGYNNNSDDEDNTDIKLPAISGE